ncbi:hypothetical protein BG003_007967 [Podila horticola]|nr:hypothetical protein BG003_007967 [Podila horticola]
MFALDNLRAFKCDRRVALGCTVNLAYDSRHDYFEEEFLTRAANAFNLLTPENRTGRVLDPLQKLLPGHDVRFVLEEVGMEAYPPSTHSRTLSKYFGSVELPRSQSGLKQFLQGDTLSLLHTFVEYLITLAEVLRRSREEKEDMGFTQTPHESIRSSVPSFTSAAKGTTNIQ